MCLALPFDLLEMLVMLESHAMDHGTYVELVVLLIGIAGIYTKWVSTVAWRFSRRTSHTYAFLEPVIENLVDGWGVVLDVVIAGCGRFAFVLVTDSKILILVIVCDLGCASCREANLAKLWSATAGGNGLHLLPVLFGEGAAALATISAAFLRFGAGRCRKT